MGRVTGDRRTDEVVSVETVGKGNAGRASFCFRLILVWMGAFSCGQQALGTPRGPGAHRDPGAFVATDFVRLVFRSADAETGRKQLEMTLEREIRGLDELCQLTEPQEQKLRLAGQGDIKRFLDRISTAQRRWEPSGKGPIELDQDLALAVAELRTEVSRGLFGQPSLFQKVRERILTRDQVARIERKAQERRDPVFYSAVRAYMRSAEKSLELTAAQSDALENMLVDTLPRTGMGTQYQNYLIAYRVSKIPEEQFAEILDQPQLEALQSLLSHARALEPFLRRQGWVEDENADQPKSQ